VEQPRPTRVALIDDNELTRTALRLALNMESVEVVVEATNGRSGLDACLRLKPDIVFLDVMMPDMGGLDILPGIRDALPFTEVIMVTASNDRATIQSSITGGAAGFIIKPFTTAVVLGALAKAQAKLQRNRAGTA
jgi:two-component system chemotaxis response regulator CheY